ncbi:response regulator transcription factor [Thiorhodospira sibirica]|uniref:response regulator transcription factor n=1 Tax=Thiorhodospira sibirica TaxID=154347 RepID=UPI00022C0B73|nr:response regulator transcription factor [Thiorhodospira sibirica]
MNKTHILIVEDDDDLREELADYLQFQGFSSDSAASLAEARALLEHTTMALILLDLNLPDGDALVLTHELSQRTAATPHLVIMTARGQTSDRIAGWQAGADAYLVKPINLAELNAIIQRLLTRTTSATPHAASTWRIEESAQTLYTPDNIAIELTGAETKLLATLFSRPGEVFAREHLCHALTLSPTITDTRKLDTLISRLRKKVSTHTGQNLPLNTFRNLGYCIPETLPSDE